MSPLSTDTLPAVAMMPLVNYQRGDITVHPVATFKAKLVKRPEVACFELPVSNKIVWENSISGNLPLNVACFYFYSIVIIVSCLHLRSLKFSWDAWKSLWCKCIVKMCVNPVKCFSVRHVRVPALIPTRSLSSYSHLIMWGPANRLKWPKTPAHTDVNFCAWTQVSYFLPDWRPPAAPWMDLELHVSATRWSHSNVCCTEWFTSQTTLELLNNTRAPLKT